MSEVLRVDALRQTLQVGVSLRAGAHAVSCAGLVCLPHECCTKLLYKPHGEQLRCM